MSTLVSKYVDKEWIVDTGASNYMTSYLDQLDNIKIVPKSERIQVHLPTGDVVSVSHMGCTKFLGDSIIGNVLFVPDFKCNLLSIS